MADTFTSGNIPEYKVQCWRRLVNSIRKQTWAASDYLAMQELLILLFTILFGTVSVFMAAVNGYEDEVLQTRKVNVFSVAWLLGRLFVKAYVAERVTDAVSVSIITEA